MTSVENNISCIDLDISIAGSGDINSSDITCNDLQVSVAGSGDMKLNNVTANFTKASVAGSGTAILSGSTQEAEYSVQVRVICLLPISLPRKHPPVLPVQATSSAMPQIS